MIMTCVPSAPHAQVAVALLMGPFWWTPFFFRLHLVMRDTRDFFRWLAGGRVRGLPESWAEWNAGQLAPLRDDARSQVPSYRRWAVAALLLPRAAIAAISITVAVTGAHFDSPLLPDWLWVLGGSAATWLVLALWSSAKQSFLLSGLSAHWRWAKGVVQVVLVLALAALAAVVLFLPKRGLRFSGLVVTLYANYQATKLLTLACVLLCPRSMAGRSLSNAALWHADKALGWLLAGVLLVVCVIGEVGLIMLDRVQTLVQFNDRFSTFVGNAR